MIRTIKKGKGKRKYRKHRGKHTKKHRGKHTKKHIRKHTRKHRRKRRGKNLGGDPSGPIRRGRKTEFEDFNAQNIVDDIVENQLGPLEDNIAECEITRRRLAQEREEAMQNAVDVIARMNNESEENDRVCDNLQKDMDKIQKKLRILNKERERLSASPIWW
jgi:chromosome segregation ATPase